MRLKETSPFDTVRANIVLNTVALEFGVVPFSAPVRKGHRQGRGSPHMVMAGQVSLYLFHTVFQMNMARVGRAFRRHPTTAQNACRVIENSRDDPIFDARIRRLEDFLRSTPTPTTGRAA